MIVFSHEAVRVLCVFMCSECVLISMCVRLHVFFTLLAFIRILMTLRP